MRREDKGRKEKGGREKGAGKKERKEGRGEEDYLHP
jgi:hypothetical protein